MCACSSGMALHGGVRPFASTFFIFTDYARPALRLACLMELPVIYVMTHDSIGLGEDGPTHQPVEHLASFRAMPHMCVIRPADTNEATWAWRAAMMRKTGPTMLVLTRQKLPIFDRNKVAPAQGLLRGAYVLSREKGETPDVILMGSGSEVHLLLDAQGRLGAEGIGVRVVSMPSWELFREQNEEYRNDVLPPDVKARLAVEAGASFGWCQWTGDFGGVIGIDRFGSSAPAQDNFEHYGFTVNNIVQRAKELIQE
jgi:transketolase